MFLEQQQTPNAHAVIINLLACTIISSSALRAPLADAADEDAISSILT